MLNLYFRGYYLHNFIIQKPPQHFATHFPEPHSFTMMTVLPSKRIDMSTSSLPCSTDPDYNILQCMEKFVTSKTGCVSPWDSFQNESNAKICETKEEFNKLYLLHKDLHHAGSAAFLNTTGCIMPCEYFDYKIEGTEWAMGFKRAPPNPSGIIVNLLDTNIKHYKQTYLYDSNR